MTFEAPIAAARRFGCGSLSRRPHRRTEGRRVTYATDVEMVAARDLEPEDRRCG